MNSSSDDNNDKSFGSTNSKILIISVVTSLVVTILIILLHFYSRYLRRRQLQEIIQRRSALYNVTTEVERTESSLTPTAGLDPSTIRSLPSFIYKPTSEAMDCAVCLGNLVEDNVIKVLPNCKHEFHVECIDKWLESSISCPVCRAMAEPAKDEGKAKREESTVGEVNQLERETESGGSRGSSFRKMFSRGRSSRRIQSIGDVDEIGTEDLDLERQ